MYTSPLHSHEPCVVKTILNFTNSGSSNGELAVVRTQWSIVEHNLSTKEWTHSLIIRPTIVINLEATQEDNYKGQELLSVFRP